MSERKCQRCPNHTWRVKFREVALYCAASRDDMGQPKMIRQGGVILGGAYEYSTPEWCPVRGEE